MARTLISSVPAAEIGKGLPLPSLTTAQRDAIASPAEGFAIYNATNKGIEIKDQAGWAALVPAGVIFPFGGAAAPDGWLLCDGAAVSRTIYSRLFASIGTTFGSGDGSATFNLPDTRGVFMRGAGSQTISSLTYTGTLGTLSNDTTKKNGLAVSGGTASLTGTTTFSSSSHSHGTPNHNHRWVEGGGGLNPWGGGYNSAVYNESGGALGGGAGGTYYTNISGAGTTGGPSGTGAVGISSTAASINTGDAETRPANIGVNHIIKI